MNCFCVSWSRDQVRQRAYWSGELVLPFQPMRCRTKTNHLLEFPSFSSFEQFSNFYFGLSIPSTNHFPSLISTCVYVPQYNFNFWQSAGHLWKLWPIWRIWIKKGIKYATEHSQVEQFSSSSTYQPQVQGIQETLVPLK